MTNEEITARMWEAYKAGKGVPHLNTFFSSIGLEELRVEFNDWIAENFRELLEQSKPHQTTNIDPSDVTLPDY